MKTAIKKWGNSYAIRLPKAIVEELWLDLNSEVEITVDEGRIIIKPCPPKGVRKYSKYTFEELASQITDENIHEAVDWGPPVGKEIWEYKE